MTSNPQEPDAQQTDDVPPGTPVPGESAPLGGTETPPAPTSREDDEDEAADPQARIVDTDEGED